MNYVYKSILGVIIGTVTFKVYKACQFQTGLPANEINEVLFLNNKSMCCNGKRDASCKNKYCSSIVIDRIVEIINAAQQSISFCMYMFSVEELCTAIISAHKRGVYVRAIADSQGFADHSQMRKLSDAGIAVIPSSGAIEDAHMHHKVCMVDTVPMPASQSSNTTTPFPNAINLPAQGVLMTGSLNWTMQALSGNWENLIITSNREFIIAFQAEFEKLWKTFNKLASFKLRNSINTSTE